MRDTLPAAEAARVAAVRRADPAARLRDALELSDTVQRLALARLRSVHPDRSDRELVELLPGRDGVATGHPHP